MIPVQNVKGGGDKISQPRKGRRENRLLTKGERRKALSIKRVLDWRRSNGPGKERVGQTQSPSIQKNGEREKGRGRGSISVVGTK